MGQGAGERVSRIGCEGALGAEACKSWGSGALQRAGHSDGEVAVAELGQDGVARVGVVQREGEWVQEVAGVPRGAVGEAGGGLRPPTAAGSTGGGEAERERGGRRLLGLFANSKKFRDPTVKLK